MMGPEERPKYQPEWFIVGLSRLRWRRRYLMLALVLALVLALSIGWYAHWGWRVFYVNHTPGTTGGNEAVTLATDHSVYFGDEPFEITVTNHLSVPIYTQVAGNINFPCTIDLYVERRVDRRDVEGEHWISSTLGVGDGCGSPCPSGTHTGIEPPRLVLAIAPGASYTQRWSPISYNPPNEPGTYRIVFRYSTHPDAPKLTYVGRSDLPRPDQLGVLGLSTATSAPVRVVDDGLRPAQTQCPIVA